MEHFQTNDDEPTMQEKLNRPVTLVPTKSDQEYVNELKERLLEAYKPVIALLTEAKKNNFEVNISTGANGFGIVQVADIKILKVY